MVNPDEELSFLLKGQIKVYLRPITPDDREQLQKGFAELSHETIRQRFHSLKKGFTEAELDFLTKVDGENHFALVAYINDQTGLGVARYIKSPTQPEKAELAVVVKDKYQNLGLGTLLLEKICEHALKHGVKEFTGMVDSQNDKMIRLLKKRPNFKVLHEHAGLMKLEGLL